jgi:hypothetical protein
MAQTYTRQSSFADGDTITAALFNDEYNQLVNAFAYSSSSASSTGHRHDGTAAQGGNIFKIGDLDFLNKIEVDSSNNRWGFYVEVSAAAVEQIRIQDGAIVPVTDSDIDLGTTSLRFKDTFTDSITTTGNVDVGGNLTVTGTTTFNGGTITMGDAADDNVVFGADVNSNIIPNTDNTYDLGSSSQEWKDLYVDGVAYLDGINFNGTAITSTAAELNILDGVTSTAAELNILDGVTSTTAELNILDGVTSTTAELNILDGVTATTAELNILDGVTSTAAELNILDGVTSTAAELNILDGVTANASELNILDGVTSTTAELNILDGVTATTTELNLLDGVTSTTAELNILDGVTSTATELNLLDGVTATTTELNYVDVATAGTVEASKAIVVDSNKDFTGGRNITITGELDAATLDISGDADIDGTLEADAITINGVTLAETISDTVGAMVTSNTETGIAVTYDDSDNTLDFVIGTLNQDTTGNAATATALETARTIHGVSFDGTANIDLTEVVQDTVGAMFSSNTETGITATYQDSDGTIDLTVTGAAVTNIADADGDTKVQVEESSDEDTIRFDTAGTERMVITSGGDVSIGPNGSNPFGISYTGTDFAVSEASGTASIQLDGGNAARMDFGVGGTALFRIYNDTSNYTEFKRTTDHPIIFNVNNAETARFLSTELKLASGKKLVGGGSSVDFTIQSEHRTEIIGASKGTVILKDQGTAYALFERPTSTNDFDIQNPISDGDITFVGNDGGSTITALTLDMSDAGRAMFNGSIDIGGGNITRTGDLTLDGSGDLILDAGGDNIKFTDSGTEIGQIDMGSQNLTFRSQVDDKDIIFRGQDGTSEIVALTLDMSEAGKAIFNGDIANASGDMTIDVAGDIILDSDGSSIRFKDGGTLNSRLGLDSAGLIVTVEGADKDFFINGDDGGSAITALRVDMSDAGALICNGNVTAFGSPSDIRLKENIEVIPDALDKVKQLKGVTFNYKKDGNKSTGLIAQDLEKVLPEVVYETSDIDNDEEKHLAVRYGNTVGLLVEAIKELEARVKELENK